MSTKSGFGLIELILAIGLFAIIAVSAITSILGSFGINRLADQETEAALYAQEGLEAVVSLRNRDWDNLATGSYGLAVSGGLWQFSGSSDTNGSFTRSVSLSLVNRNCERQIVSSGGIPDVDTWKATATVNWSPSPTRNNQVELVRYLTNFHKDWANSIQYSSANLSGAQDALKVQVGGCYAYVIRNNNGSNNFSVVDISNPFVPTVTTTISLNGIPQNLAVSGNYAYVVSTSDTQELQVVDISNPASPSLIGSLDLTGSTNMSGIYVLGSTAYLGRLQSSAAEFYVVNVTTPSAPSLTGSLELGATASEVYANGTHAYLSSFADLQELQIIDVSIPALPLLVGFLNLTGSPNATTIDGFTNRVVLGRIGGLMHIVDVTNPLLPAELASFDAGLDINDLAVGHSELLVLLATRNSSAEFQVVDISNNSSPVLYESQNAVSEINGVGYDNNVDRGVGVSGSDTQEMIIYGPR